VVTYVTRNALASDPADAADPILARAMRVRRDNLKILLEQRLDKIRLALPEAVASAA
jgi:hypothetical protein